MKGVIVNLTWDCCIIQCFKHTYTQACGIKIQLFQKLKAETMILKKIGCYDIIGNTTNSISMISDSSENGFWKIQYKVHVYIYGHNHLD